MIDCDSGGFLVDAGDGRPAGDGAYGKPLLGPDPHEGTVYTVAGTGGRSPAGGPLDHPAIFVALNTLGSLVLDFDKRGSEDLCLGLSDFYGSWQLRALRSGQRCGECVTR